MLTNCCQHHHQTADAGRKVNLELLGFADWTSVGKTSGKITILVYKNNCVQHNHVLGKNLLCGLVGEKGEINKFVLPNYL